MIISGGENIATPEVERALYEHPAVLEAAVVSSPDLRWGEVPAAYVALRPGAEATDEEIIAHCTARLAKFKTQDRPLRRRATAQPLRESAQARAAEAGQRERSRPIDTAATMPTHGLLTRDERDFFLRRIEPEDVGPFAPRRAARLLFALVI